MQVAGTGGAGSQVAGAGGWCRWLAQVTGKLWLSVSLIIFILILILILILVLVVSLS